MKISPEIEAQIEQIISKHWKDWNKVRNGIYDIVVRPAECAFARDLLDLIYKDIEKELKLTKKQVSIICSYKKVKGRRK